MQCAVGFVHQWTRTLFSTSMIVLWATSKNMQVHVDPVFVVGPERVACLAHLGCFESQT